MTDSAIQKSIENKRLKLTLGQMESHYLIVIVFFLPFFIVLFAWVKDLIMGSTTQPNSDFEYILIGGAILGCLAFWFQYSRLKFIELESNPSEERFQELLNKIESMDNWHISYKTDKAIIIKTTPKWTSGSWGEQVTILRDGKRVLVNSICDPDNHSSVFSAGRNSSNVEGIINFFEKPIANMR